ncbi:MAG: DUF4419 domain-containing protein [Moorea sp. SIO2B7]|nr:DUF4419 domain-containing protein [Moorena sp. SIO2B7]
MTKIAPILEKAPGKIRFRVDDVQNSQKRLSVENAKTQFEQQFKNPVLAFSYDDSFEVIETNEIHPLAMAVHTAFSQHHSLLLTPDIIWLTIAQGFAQHINNHAETLRSRFVTHQDKKKLTVETIQIPKSAEHWESVIQEWTLQIRDHVGAELYRLLECNFSTTTPITKTASHVVMMDAFRQYFDYGMRCVCGIPEITILGTVEDWQSISSRVQNMASYELNWWTDRLLPICQEFVNTASGKPSLEFWRAIYKPKKIYGGELINGWLAELFPYLKHLVTNAASVPNPMLTIERENLTVDDGISPNSLPLGLSHAPFKLTIDNKKYSLELVAGFIGVHHNSNKGVLQPEIGWAVRAREGKFANLLDKIEQEHITELPINWYKFNPGFYVPFELIQILERFDGATLYPNSGHSWMIKKHDFCQRKMYSIAGNYCRAHHHIN